MGGASAQFQASEGQDQAFTADDLTQPMEPRVGEFRCPHCGSGMFRRHSREVTDHFRDIIYQCRNLACACTIKASLSLEYVLSPSGVPNPACDLPFRPLARVPGVTVADADEPHDPNQFKLFD